MMQDIALAGYFKFKYAVTKIYYSCWIGMPVVVFVLLLGSPFWSVSLKSRDFSGKLRVTLLDHIGFLSNRG